jgi:hypothetical protein
VPNSLVEEEINVFDYELEELISHMKCQMLEVFLPFISLMHGFFFLKGHNMLAIMLNPKYKNICLVIIYSGHEATTTLVVDYDKQLLLPLLLEVYKGLLPNGGVYLTCGFSRSIPTN